VNGNRFSSLLLLTLFAAMVGHAAAEQESVLREKLDNGLRVVEFLP
jgi:hypothetical protein